jgi:hypothetical protein
MIRIASRKSTESKQKFVLMIQNIRKRQNRRTPIVSQAAVIQLTSTGLEKAHADCAKTISSNKVNMLNTSFPA